MKLYLVRHGEAVSDLIDPTRPLNPEGAAKIEQIARFLGRHSFPLERILHSQKLRAKQTAEIMGKYIAPEAVLLAHPQLAPNDPIDGIEHELHGGDCMLVGHLPFLPSLLGKLVAGNEGHELVRFREGTTVCLTGLQGRWIIDWVISQELV